MMKDSLMMKNLSYPRAEKTEYKVHMQANCYAIIYDAKMTTRHNYGGHGVDEFLGFHTRLGLEDNARFY